MKLNKYKLSLLILLFLPTILSADWIYFPKEYNEIYKEKYALELELQDLKRQYQNELAGLQSEKENFRIKSLSLAELLAQEKSNRSDENKLHADRLNDAEMRRKSLEQSGTEREKSILSDAKRKEAKDKAEIDRLVDKIQNDLKLNLEKEQEMRKEYQSKIEELNLRIRNFENEISSLKQMNKNQKKELERLSDQAKELEDKLSKEIASGQIRVKRFHNKLIINIDDRLSFDSGSAELKREILPAIDKVKKILASYPENFISVEGHTDNVPIRTKFRDNWQLSTERALSVLAQLLTNKKLNPRNFAAAGYSEYQPLVPNTSGDNKGLNRRVDIVVIPKIIPKAEN